MPHDIKNYTPPMQSHWLGRADTENGRFFQRVKLLNLQKEPVIELSNKVAIIGFACDEGIKRNSGRIGAADGPDALRSQLARLPVHYLPEIYDLGSIICEGDLAQAQEELARVIHNCHLQNCKTIILGGGHEVAWGHYQGLTAKYPRLGIINFDAHFDLRSCADKTQGTSGTPFLQIAQWCQTNQRNFDYCCLGIQPHSNTTDLFNKAHELKVQFLTAEQISRGNIAWQTAFLDDFLLHHQAIYLSLCMDVFAESCAPGVSAPQALGLLPWQVLPLLKYIMQTGKVVSFDIAELAPRWDIEQKTARLGATMIAEIFDL